MATATAPKKKSKPTTKVTPLGNKILVRRDEAQGVTDAGIVLPESAKDRPRTGVVEAVGTGAINTETGERIPVELKKGERVIFSSYAGTELKLGADELLIMSEDEILAVID